jgi:uncharacterized membrane protein
MQIQNDVETERAMPVSSSALLAGCIGITIGAPIGALIAGSLISNLESALSVMMAQILTAWSIYWLYGRRKAS